MQYIWRCVSVKEKGKRIVIIVVASVLTLLMLGSAILPTVFSLMGQ